MSGIFITYRRDDSLGFAGRLDDDLTERFGDELIFRDREIAPGEDFSRRLLDTLAAVAVTVAVIGPRWTEARDAAGRRRLDQPDDWVRVELETALGRGIPVVPVLVGGARMPAREDLPDSLGEFARRQAFHLSDRRWRQEVDELALQLARLSPVLDEALRRRGGAGSRGSAAHHLREMGRRVIDEALRRRHARRPRARGVSRPLLSWFGRTLRRLLTQALVLVVLYLLIRRAGGRELNALLDQLIASVVDAVNTLF